MSPRAPRAVRLLSAAVLTLATIGLSACAVTPPDQNASWSPVPGGNGNPGTDAVGSVTGARVDAAVAALPGYIDQVLATSGVPGMAVAVVHGDRTLLARGFGVRNLETGEAVDADTVFQLASLSKSVGATVVAGQVGQKKVAWNTPVVTHLPGFELADPWVTEHVTIADLYAHRSGLPDHVGDELEDLGYDRAEVLRRLRLAPLDSFRVTEHYTNFGLTAAAEAVSRASGQDWETLSEQTLYQPLGMTSTSSRFEDFVSRPNRATGHVPIDGRWGVTTLQRKPDAQSPAGGVSSTARDMAAWMRFVLAEGRFEGADVVPAEALRPAITAQFVTRPAGSPAGRAGLTGYGFNVGTTPGGLASISHSGAFSLGTGTAFTMLPGQGLGIVVLTNGSPVGAAEAVAAQFMDLAQFGAPRQDWWKLANAMLSPLMAPAGELAGKSAPAAPAPAKALAEYAGTYTNAYYGAAEVSVVGGELQLGLGPAGMRWTLAHWDGDTFTYRPYNENAPPGSVGRASFDDPNLVLELLDGQGLGRFRRG